MNDFDWDSKQKKEIARSARHMTGKRGRRGCTLPSDNLTEAQRRKLNGECRTYTLREPLTYEQFKDLPDDLKREYMLWLQEAFKANDQSVADMFGVTRQTVREQRAKLCIDSIYQPRQRMPKECVTAWEDWLRAYEPECEGEPAPESNIGEPIPLRGVQPTDGVLLFADEPTPEEAAEEKMPFIKVKLTPEPEPERAPSKIETCRFTASGAAGATAELLLGLFKGDPRKAHFTVEVSFD